MGQKVNPIGFRVGIKLKYGVNSLVKDWESKWYAKNKDFSKFLVEDFKIRKFLKKMLYAAGVPKIEIERAANKVKINVYASKPGIIIGKAGAGIEEIKKRIEKLIGKSVLLNITEVSRPDLDAQLVAENIAAQLEKRTSFRRAMKQSMSRTMKSGAKGIKTQVSGRVGGAEIARTEHYHEGMIPLQTLRANIDYGFAEANTTYGKIGVKVWIYKGEILPSKKKVEGRKEANNNVNA